MILLVCEAVSAIDCTCGSFAYVINKGSESIVQILVVTPVQKTLKQKISLEGVGLHSGKSSKMTLSPAPLDSGIVFRRKTGGHAESCQATIHNVFN